MPTKAEKMKAKLNPIPAPEQNTGDLPGQISMFDNPEPSADPETAAEGATSSPEGEKVPKNKKAAQDPEPAKKEKGKLASFYVMPDDYRRYQALAKATGKTLSRFIGDAVAEYARRQKLTPDQQTLYDILMKL